MVSDTTGCTDDGRWAGAGGAHRPEFGVVAQVLSLAMLVSLIALVSTAVGAAHSLGREAPVQTPNIFAPTSTPAFAIRDLSRFVLGICAVIFVGGLLTYSVVRFRRRPGVDSGEPLQVYGSNQIELAWTVVPVLIVVVLFLATARYIAYSARRGWHPRQQ